MRGGGRKGCVCLQCAVGPRGCALAAPLGGGCSGPEQAHTPLWATVATTAANAAHGTSRCHGHMNCRGLQPAVNCRGSFELAAAASFLWELENRQNVATLQRLRRTNVDVFGPFFAAVATFSKCCNGNVATVAACNSCGTVHVYVCFASPLGIRTSSVS